MTAGTVGNYKLLEKLGEGGMGAVYKGVDLMVERPVAIKMLRPEIASQPGIVERFRAEAVALAKLNHPNIATLYSFFREGDEYFMVMEFVTGRTLESIIREARAITVDEALHVSTQVLDAIEHAHSYGILHRDIKPANIMLTEAGQVKVTDFGIARVLGTARMTGEGCICGTLEYLAPERIKGQEADIRSDLYSMGIVLYEMLSGHLPFERASAYDLMRAHLEETPPSFASLGVASVPAALESIVSRALAKFPEERFATAGEFRAALAGAAGIGPVELTWGAAEPSNYVRAVLNAAVRDSGLRDVGAGQSAGRGLSAAAAAPARIPTPPAPVEAPADLADVPAVAPVAPRIRPHWKLYASVAVALVLMALALLLWNRKQGPAEARTPAPVPVMAQPSSPAAQPQGGGQPGAPASSAAQPGAETQDVPPNAPADQGPVAGSPPVNGGKAKPAAPSAAEVQRRKAALKALEKGETPAQAKTDKRDRRSSSLDALKN